MLKIVTFILGPVETNAYLVADDQLGEAVVIDPAWDGDVILAEANRRKWRITSLWVTHAHFDHIAGVAEISGGMTPPPAIALHRADLSLWSQQGLAPLFGMEINLNVAPSIWLEHGNNLALGDYRFQVHHTPGHTPGHVVLHCRSQKVAFCGDVIFRGGVGRTDTPGGSYSTLMQSIRTQIMSMPDDTRLLSGHGPETTVGEERRENPFL